MDYEKVAAYWSEKDQTSRRMEKTALLAEIETFIKRHRTCVLGTGGDGFIRCTPLEYTYKDGRFWIFSEGGLKFRGLERNKSVGLAIYEPYQGMGTAKGLQVQGQAAVVTPWSEDYVSLLEYKKLPVEGIRRMAGTLHLIRITPQSMDFLDFALRKQGVDARQHIDF